MPNKRKQRGKKQKKQGGEKVIGKSPGADLAILPFALAQTSKAVFLHEEVIDL